MSERKSFLLRIDRDVFAAIERWAADDLRSVNAQVEVLLRRALQQAGRAPAKRGGGGGRPAPDSDGP